MERISSRQNPLVTRFRDAAHGPGDVILLEGATLVGTAIAAGMTLDVAALRPHAPERLDAAEAALVQRLTHRHVRVVLVTPAVLDAMSPARSPSGVVALARRPSSGADALFTPAPALVLVLVDVQDPGNVGAIVRVADAAGATGVITTPACADPFGWKALRGSMGSAFRVPMWPGAAWSDTLSLLRGHGARIVATSPRAAATLYERRWRGPTAVVMGTEGAGLPAALADEVDDVVAVPMRDGVESLNVAVTAALLAYEVRRQRA